MLDGMVLRRASQWARKRGLFFGSCVGIALAMAAFRQDAPSPGRDLGALAAALGRAARHASVAPDDIRWAPSEGALSDLVTGRWAVFLARSPGEETRDVWRARVRVSPEGSVIDVASAHDLTSTPLGDDHELVLRGQRAAFATRAYGQEQSVTAFFLAGEGSQNKAVDFADRAMAAVTSLQLTGSAEGVGRTDVTLESPARAVDLELDEGSLQMTLFGGDPRRAPTVTSAHLDLESGEVVPPVAGARATGGTTSPLSR